MTRGVLLVCLASSLAAADTIKAPAGWTADPDAAAKLDRRGQHFDGAVSTVKVEVYKPVARGAVLYVTRVTAAVPADQRNLAASSELTELAAAMKRQGKVTTDASAQKADPDRKQLESAVRWRDDGAGLVTSARIVIAADATTITAVRGDCLLAADVAKDVAAACEAALATLDPGVPADKREALVMLATPEQLGLAKDLVVLPPGSVSLSGSSGEAVPDTPQTRLGDGSRTPLPPINVAPPEPQRETDRRPVYVGLGLVVLAIAFWYNRRRRERFEREDGRPVRSKRAASDRDDGDGDGGDDDADDLHAAAADAPEKDAITKESHD